MKELKGSLIAKETFIFSFFRDNININDVLGGYSLTLIDSLDTLAVSENLVLIKLEKIGRTCYRFFV